MVVLADSLDRGKSARWQRGDRFYRCEVREDLFGNWVVVRFWGGVNSGKRGTKETVCQSYAEAEALFEAVAKRRARRRYVRVD
jgi:WGR domain